MPKTSKRNARISLPGGCSMSTPCVHPANWETTTKAIGTWYISFRFYDPVLKPKGKLCIIKGMNDYKDPDKRRQITAYLLEEEMAKLKSGFNLVTERYYSQEENIDGLQNMPLARALTFASEKLEVGKLQGEDIKIMLYWVQPAIIRLAWTNMAIGDLRPRHIKTILETCRQITFRIDQKNGQQVRTKCPIDPETGIAIWSNHKYNKYRTNFMILLEPLVELEVFDSNPVKSTKAKKKVKRKRETLTLPERKLISCTLRQFTFLDRNPQIRLQAYGLLRLIEIFFHAGSRTTELLAIQRKHVRLQYHQFLKIVKKGPNYVQTTGTIKEIAMHWWEELVNTPNADGVCDPDDYLFSEDLRPGPRQIRREQIPRRWKLWIKDGLGILADFYSLKHSNTDETDALHGEELAADHNSHTSTAMVVDIYAVGKAARKHEQLKKVNNSFA
jgi:hypothetical protein